MSDLDEERAPVDEQERKQLRPYRRLVGAIFSLAVLVASALVLRGIVRHLDRMPSIEALAKPPTVDVRALRACAEDLDRLEARVRVAASQVFAVAPAEDTAPIDWDTISRPLELDRLSVVARCRLHEPSPDAVVAELNTAATEIEGLMRSYALLYARHLESGLPHSIETKRAVRRALAALATR